MSHSLYILIHGGDAESVWATSDRDNALSEAQLSFLQWFWDFQKHRIRNGEVILATEDRVSTDWRLVEVSYGDLQESVSEIELPFQEWINEALAEAAAERVKEAQMEADPEWAEYQRLCEKFRGY